MYALSQALCGLMCCLRGMQLPAICRHEVELSGIQPLHANIVFLGEQHCQVLYVPQSGHAMMPAASLPGGQLVDRGAFITNTIL